MTPKSANPKTATIGTKGAVVLPAKMRRRFGLEKGVLVIVEEREGGLLIRPAQAVLVETYDKEQQASFLLSNAVGAEDYARAAEAVRALGLDPDRMPHLKPDGTIGTPAEENPAKRSANA